MQFFSPKSIHESEAICWLMLSAFVSYNHIVVNVRFILLLNAFILEGSEFSVAISILVFKRYSSNSILSRNSYVLNHTKSPLSGWNNRNVSVRETFSLIGTFHDLHLSTTWRQWLVFLRLVLAAVAHWVRFRQTVIKWGWSVNFLWKSKKAFTVLSFFPIFCDRKANVFRNCWP